MLLFKKLFWNFKEIMQKRKNISFSILFKYNFTKTGNIRTVNYLLLSISVKIVYWNFTDIIVMIIQKPD